jgi:hypothetical protein
MKTMNHHTGSTFIKPSSSITLQFLTKENIRQLLLLTVQYVHSSLCITHPPLCILMGKKMVYV